MRDWLINNIVPILAIAIIGTTLALYVISAVQLKPIDKEVLRDMRDLCLIIVGFYFGSSDGSKQKTNILNKQRNS